MPGLILLLIVVLSAWAFPATFKYLIFAPIMGVIFGSALWCVIAAIFGQSMVEPWIYGCCVGGVALASCVIVSLEK